MTPGEITATCKEFLHLPEECRLAHVVVTLAPGLPHVTVRAVIEENQYEVKELIADDFTREDYFDLMTTINLGFAAVLKKHKKHRVQNNEPASIPEPSTQPQAV